MPRFRKKPVVIEAIQYAGTIESANECCLDLGPGNTVGVPTLEGFMVATAGDWIITGVKGERYPCKPDIFVATYEPIED